MFVAAAGLSIGGLELWHEESQRNAELAQVGTSTFNLARSLAQHAEDTFEMADEVLVDLVERLETDGTSPAALDRVQRMARTRTAPPSRLRAIFIYDQNGAWLANSLGISPPDANNADRAYFQHHRDRDDGRPFLGNAVRSRSEGQWIITVSRRFNHPDGRFAGVVLATLDVTYFSQFYSAFNIGSKGAITLIHPGGSILARYPHDEAFAGRQLPPTSPFYADAHLEFGIRRYTAGLDGVDRIAAFRRGKRFPVVIATAVSVDEALAEWRASALTRMLVAGVLGGMMVLMGSRLVGYVVRQRRTEAALKASEADFRLLAENSDDMVVRIGPDGIRRYVSPAATKLVGRTPEELVGRPVRDHIDAEDLPAVQREVKRLQIREVDAVLLTYRVRRPNGTAVWLESSVRTAFDAKTGDADGMVAITRDVTERKRLEDELSILARTDGLTGLANRRTFDELLGMEFARAKRDGTSLSLVMLDLDRFKTYNDTYGHQAGDQCLIALATIMTQRARRPADIVARYGGEEFALLLPNTDTEGAKLIAERVRADLQALAIAHVHNVPMCTVTLSAGVADRKSLPAASTPTDLIAAADHQLYKAKADGRNRIATPVAAAHLKLVV